MLRPKLDDGFEQKIGIYVHQIYRSFNDDQPMYLGGAISGQPHKT